MELKHSIIRLNTYIYIYIYISVYALGPMVHNY